MLKQTPGYAYINVFWQTMATKPMTQRETQTHRGLSDHSPWKSLRTESTETEDSLNVDGDLGSTIIWTSLETDIVCPVIAPSVPLWSHSPLGVTSRLKGRERGDIYKPITARLVKPPSAGHSSISYTPLTPPGEKSTGLEPIPNYRVTNTHKTETETETDLDLLILPQSLNAKVLIPNKYSLQKER